MIEIYIKNFIKKFIIFNSIGLKLTKFSGYESYDLKIIKNNSKFKNIHKGERCFILGNGPSINLDDLTKLENEVTFVVNQVSKCNYYNIIKPNYFFCVDPVFFNLDVNDPCDAQTIQSFKNLKNDFCNPICFIPAKHKEVINRYGIDNLNIEYFVDAFRMTDNWKSYIDYSKVVPSFGTVVQYAITMAVYMGFSKIYLLGCDNTGIVATINSILKVDNSDQYAYKVSTNENNRMERMVSRSSLENYCESYLYTLQDYRKLNNYCSRYNVEIINCSSKTVIDSIPRMHLQDII